MITPKNERTNRIQIIWYNRLQKAEIIKIPKMVLLKTGDIRGTYKNMKGLEEWEKLTAISKKTNMGKI